MSRLADSTSPDIAALGRASVLAIPLGSTEQHGPHLPLSTDTDTAIALCERLAAERDDVAVAPAMPYGSSGEHAGFAGTLSIGQQAVELVVLELGRSASETFDHVLFVSAHGGNATAVSRAVARLRVESRDVSVFFPAWDGDAHAGFTETSLMLALRPETVHLQRRVVGDVRPIAELMPQLRRGGVHAVTATGVLGDPRDATARDGAAILDALTDDLHAHVRRWRDES
jgi:mycofactocin system creatininase family protein